MSLNSGYTEHESCPYSAIVLPSKNKQIKTVGVFKSLACTIFSPTNVLRSQGVHSAKFGNSALLHLAMSCNALDLNALNLGQTLARTRRTLNQSHIMRESLRAKARGRIHGIDLSLRKLPESRLAVIPWSWRVRESNREGAQNMKGTRRKTD